jgi:hypothetical protein
MCARALVCCALFYWGNITRIYFPSLQATVAVVVVVVVVGVVQRLSPHTPTEYRNKKRDE